MKKVIFATLVSLLLLTGNAFAALLYSPVTNHSYARIDGSLTWTQAQLAAAAYDPAHNSYLAVITSQEENAWIWNNLGGSALNQYWIGGSQVADPSDPTNTEAGWSWVTGETWSYANWDTVEANDWPGSNVSPHVEQGIENYLQFSQPNGSVGNLGLGTWNDEDNGYFPGYVVESLATPEPASMALLGFGLLGVIGTSFRKRFAA